MEKILWSSQTHPIRYFWVPAGEDVFVGDYVIENNEGESFSVDLESLIPFEVNSAQAEALMMQDLENMTKELGGLFKGLFQLGKRMLDNEVLEDSEEDSDWDSDSDDGDDIDKILELFDEESSSDWDSENDSDDLTIEDLLSQFGDDLEDPLTELKDIITKELGNLGEELDNLGKEAAESIDEHPEAGQSILRELGEWLIRLADDQDSNSLEEDDVPIIMPFPSIPEPSSLDESTEGNTVSEPDAPLENIETTVSDIKSVEFESNEENTSAALDEPSVEATEKLSIDWPSSSALKRMNKSALIDFGESLGLTLSMTQSKTDLLASIETLR